MNQPDDYFKFDGNVFFQAVKGLPPYIALAYLRAIWYYIHHNHCKGLKDDDDFLMRLCEIDLPRWKDARAIIFDDSQFFVLVGGLWHQKRAREDYKETKYQYEKKVSAGKKGAAARWRLPDQG